MFKKIKNWLGIEGVKIEIAEVSVDESASNQVNGVVELTTQSAQEIEKLIVTIREKYSRGRRKKSKLVDEYVLGKKEIELHQAIDVDQPITASFAINYALLKSDIEKLGEKNILYKGISKLAKVAKNAKSSYSLTVEAVVKGNALKPYDKVEIEL